MMTSLFIFIYNINIVVHELKHKSKRKKLILIKYRVLIHLIRRRSVYYLL